MENKKRHRRTKAEMELARELDIIEQPKQKRHRRTKAEMELVRELKDDNTEDSNDVEDKPIKTETVKLKYDLNGIPKDTILSVIDTPINQISDDFYIWVEHNNIKTKILKFSVFYVI